MWYKSQLQPILVVWPWASHFTSLCLSFLTCKMRIIAIWTVWVLKEATWEGDARGRAYGDMGIWGYMYTYS